MVPMQWVLALPLALVACVPFPRRARAVRVGFLSLYAVGSAVFVGVVGARYPDMIAFPLFMVGPGACIAIVRLIVEWVRPIGRSGGHSRGDRWII
jgi:hypothetical protein